MTAALRPLPSELRLGALRVATPVVLAPMAGITNAAYRRLCREQGAGLYVAEMTTSRGVVERDETTLRMLVFDETEDVRSVQLYGTDPVYVGKATEILCAEYGVSHVDLNDDVVEGLRALDLPAFSVQYHPEAAAGPHDAAYLFDRFLDLMTSAKEQPHHAS